MSMNAFAPACDFLLGLSYPNLFDPGANDNEFRCKGCGATVQRRDRAKHHSDHRRVLRRNQNGGNKVAALEVNQKVIDRIVRQIDEGMGLTAVAEGLNKDGVKVPGRAKTWYAPTVRNIYLKTTGKTSIADVRKKNPLASKAAAKTTGKRTATPDPKTPAKASSRTTRGRGKK